MAHFRIEYSQNVAEWVDIQNLCDRVRRAAIETGVFPMPGIRVRAFAAAHSSSADGAADHGFVDILIRLREGRSEAEKAKAAESVFQAAEAMLAPVMEAHSLALSLELRDIDDRFSPKTGSTRKFLGKD